MASFAGHAELVGLLLDHDGRVYVRTNHGVTALHLAAFKGHEKVVRLLLDRGADVNAIDDQEKNPAHRRARRRAPGDR